MTGMKRLIGLFSALALTMVLSLTGCGKNEETKPLVFGLMPSEDAIPLLIAQDRGYYENSGLDVEFQVFRSAKDRNAAFQSGELDGIIGDQTAIVLYQSGGFDVKIASYTNCDFSFITAADSNVSDWQGLEGKSVAISELTVIEYALDKMLEENGMTSDSVVKTAIPAIPARVEMLANDQVDSALLPEPFASLALGSGGFLLGKASDMDMRITVLAFSQAAIDEKRSAIDKFLSCYDEGVDYVNSTPISEYEAFVIEAIGFPETMAGNVTLPEYDHHGLPSEAELEEVIAWAASKGVDMKDMKAKDLVME